MSDPSAMPPLPLTGGCQCGAVRYRITEAPATLYACHCTDCQRQSGSAFGLSMQVRAASVEVEGKTSEFAKIAASGRRMACVFCPACGTRLWHARAEGADFVSLKPGTLDATGWLAPVAHIWTASAQPWAPIPADTLSWPGQPDMQAMREAWARRGG